MKFSKPKEKSVEVMKRKQPTEEPEDSPNRTRLDILQDMTRGLQMPKQADSAARESFYRARDNFVKNSIALNYTDTEICRILKISGHMLSQIKARVFNNEIETIQKMSQLEHYVEYKLKQMEVIKDLDVLIEKFRSGNNLQGLSGALKAKSEALKELKEAAQEVGLLDRKPEEVILVNGTNVKDLSNQELLGKIADGYKTIQRLMDNVIPFKPKQQLLSSQGEEIPITAVGGQPPSKPRVKLKLKPKAD